MQTDRHNNNTRGGGGGGEGNRTSYPTQYHSKQVKVKNLTSLANLKHFISLKILDNYPRINFPTTLSY